MSVGRRPVAFIDITSGGATYRSPDTDGPILLPVPRGDDPRQVALRRTVWEARRLGQSIELVTTGDHGEHRILVAPDGTLTPATADREVDAFTETTPRSALGLPSRRITPPPADEKSVAVAAPMRTGGSRPSFITPDTDLPAQGFLARMGVPATRGQVRRSENVRAVSQHWGGCRMVAVVNGKGGVGKTMTSAMLAAVFARHGGSGVLAWDNNDTRGTLGWRTESAHHGATLHDLLTAAPTLLAPTAGTADIAAYVHHQTADGYDVLRSNPLLLAAGQRLDPGDFDLLVQVAARYFRLVVFDSGNDESASRWLRMIDTTDQLVIPTLASPESAESAALLLDALAARDAHSAELARQAVVVVTQHEPGSTTEARRIARAFAGMVRAVEVVPHDRALKSGPLRFDALRPTSRNAWIAAAAAIADGLE